MIDLFRPARALFCALRAGLARRPQARVVLASGFLLLLLVATLSPARAQSEETEDSVEAFVYGINASVPGAVMGTFAPPVVETIYFLTDHVSILSPRRTEVYYWPITNEYRASWSTLNEVVDGTLEILSGAEIVAELDQEVYTIHFSQGDLAPRPQMYIGDEAIEADRTFLQLQESFRQASLAYQVAREQWLASAREAQAAGEDPTQFGPAPEPPAPFNLYSTGLNQGFPINLPVGEYRLRLRMDDGSVLPESERDLIVFAARRSAIGYEVLPEERWTFPEELNAPSDAILGEQGSVIYLKPRVVREFPSLAYERLQDPQYVGTVSGSEWTWASGEPLQDGYLEVVRNGQVLERLSYQEFFVRQMPGQQLGYEILPYDSATPDLTPRVDFDGFRLPLTGEMSTFQVRITSADAGPLSGSARQVRVVQPVSWAIVALFPMLVIALGVGFLTWRQRKTTMDAASSAGS